MKFSSPPVAVTIATPSLAPAQVIPGLASMEDNIALGSIKVKSTVLPVQPSLSKTLMVKSPASNRVIEVASKGPLPSLKSKVSRPTALSTIISIEPLSSPLQVGLIAAPCVILSCLSSSSIPSTVLVQPLASLTTTS